MGCPGRGNVRLLGGYSRFPKGMTLGRSDLLAFLVILVDRFVLCLLVT